MRSFSKKLAFVLAAAMVVTSFAPAASAKAAGEMAINKSSQILYVNEGINHKGGEVAAPGKGNVSVYDFSVKNKPADWKDTLSFKWTSSDEDVVSVAKGGVATAVSVGKATITCKVTDKATKETVATLKTKVTVKANAYDVEISNADDVAGLAYEVGSTIDLDRTMYDEDGNDTTKRGTLVTDYTRWIAEPATGVSITQSNGKFTFSEAGEYTLYCQTYQSSKYTETTSESQKIKVTIVDNSIELKQTVNNVFEINFGKEMDLGLTGVVVEHVIKGVDAVSKDECLVKEVTMSEDKKTATVEMFYEFEDGEEYEITVKGYDTETMLASNGAPVKAVLHTDKDDINSRQVLVGVEAPIYFKLYDANGVQVESGSTSEDIENADIEYSIKYANTDYENVGNTLFFNEAGDRAVVTLTYHTWNYDTNTAEELGAFTSSAFTFVGVSKANVAVKSLKDYAVNAEYWRGDAKNVVKMEDDSRWLEIKLVLTDNVNKEIVINDPTNVTLIADDNETLIGDVVIKSLNEDVLAIYEGTNRGGNAAFSFNPRKEGTALVKVSYVTDVNGVDVETTIGTVKIVVSGAKRMATATPWANTTTIVTDPVIDAATGDNKNFRDKEYGFTVKDQYGDDYGNYIVKSIVGTTNLSKEAVEREAIKIVGTDKFVLDDSVFGDIIRGNNAASTSGSFFFTITLEDQGNYATKTISFSVYARIAGENPKTTLAIDVDMTSVNDAGGNVARIFTDDGNRNNENQKFATFTVYEMYNGGKYNEVVVEGRKTAEALETAVSGQYYYTIKRNGAEMIRNDSKDDNSNGILWEQYANVPGLSTVGNGSQMRIDFTADKMYVPGDWETNPLKIAKQGVIGDGNMFVDSLNYYDVYGGAGTYEFILWEVVENKKGDLEYARKLSRTVTTSFDAGSYSFQKRLGVTIDVTDNTIGGAEMNQKLLGCFKIADRLGNTYDKDATSWNNIVDGTKVNMGGHEKLYYVNCNWANDTETSVYVKEIVFFEAVDTGVYTEYVVPVGYYVTVK